MSNISDLYGTVFFVRWNSGIINQLPIPVDPDIAYLERCMRAAYDLHAAEGGNSVRLMLTDTLNTALLKSEEGHDLDAVIAAAALGLLVLHKRDCIAVIDREDQYEYLLIADVEGHLKQLKAFARREARRVRSRQKH
jgi:hypothetical protein